MSFPLIRVIPRSSAANSYFLPPAAPRITPVTFRRPSLRGMDLPTRVMVIKKNLSRGLTQIEADKKQKSLGPQPYNFSADPCNSAFIRGPFLLLTGHRAAHHAGNFPAAFFTKTSFPLFARQGYDLSKESQPTVL